MRVLPAIKVTLSLLEIESNVFAHTKEVPQRVASTGMSFVSGDRTVFNLLVNRSFLLYQHNCDFASQCCRVLFCLVSWSLDFGFVAVVFLNLFCFGLGLNFLFVWGFFVLCLPLVLVLNTKLFFSLVQFCR